MSIKKLWIADEPLKGRACGWVALSCSLEFREGNGDNREEKFSQRTTLKLNN
jgi:hypothetical protein